MHAGDYGMSVPEELRPKMKESSAMAKALRALDALPHAPRPRGGGGAQRGACAPRSRHPCVT